MKTMARPEAAAEARRLADAIERNVGDVDARRIEWDTFSTRNEAIWREAATDPRVHSMVLGILRNDPNWEEE